MKRAEFMRALEAAIETETETLLEEASRGR